MLVLFALLLGEERAGWFIQLQQKMHGTTFANVLQNGQPLTHATHQTDIAHREIFYFDVVAKKTAKPRHMWIHRGVAVFNRLDIIFRQHHLAQK